MTPETDLSYDRILIEDTDTGVTLLLAILALILIALIVGVVL